jgi:hypothetical protein
MGNASGLTIFLRDLVDNDALISVLIEPLRLIWMEIEAQEEGANGLSSESSKGLTETSQHTKCKGMTSKCNIGVQDLSRRNEHEGLETPKVTCVLGGYKIMEARNASHQYICRYSIIAKHLCLSPLYSLRCHINPV